MYQMDYCKTALVLCCLLVARARCQNPAAMEDDIADMGAYLKRFQNINVDQVLSNERVINSHIKCFLGEGPCIQQSRELKRAIPIIAKKGCVSCNERQITSIKKALKFMSTKKPQEWDKLVKLFDPTGLGLKKFID